MILFGEHFVVYGGSAIVTAIEPRVTAVAREGSVPGIAVRQRAARYARGSCGAPARSKRIEGGARPLEEAARAVAEMYGVSRGLEIDVDSQVPRGEGLGWSSSSCVAVAGAVARFCADATGRRLLSRAGVAEAALRGERAASPYVSGVDSTASALGGTLEYSTATGPRAVKASQGVELIIMSSGRMHSTGAMISAVRRFKEANAEAFAAMMDEQTAMMRTARRALAAGDLAVLGRCMSENQERLERLGVSSAAIRRIAGIAGIFAHGAKVTGAGGGGSVIALVGGGTVPSSGMGRAAPHIRSLLGCSGLEYL